MKRSSGPLTDTPAAAGGVPSGSAHPGAASRLRFRLLAGGAVLTAVVAAALAVVLDRDQSGPAEFHGTVLQEPRTPPAFTLEDQHGHVFSLSDARGKTVALTFLYTSCTDTCPFVGIKLRSALEVLGDAAEDIVLVAISMDPDRDTLGRISEYTSELGIFDKLHYVTGSRDELLPLWNGYLIGEPVIGSESEFADREELDFYGLTAGLDEGEIADAYRARTRFGGGYDVSHGAPVWLINGDGEMVAKLEQSGTPREWADDISAVVSGL